MPTVAREIDALGGAGAGSWHDGYHEALTSAETIAENADALIEELLETIDDILVGNTTLAVWVKQAQLVLTRARHRRAQ